MNEGDGSTDDDLAHVLIKYIVPPSKHDDFIEAWQDAQEDTDKEEGVRIYSLRKVFTDNYQFYVYGTWDSMEDYADHFE